MPGSKITRRQAIRLAGLGGLGAALELGFPSTVLGWGSVWATNTHGFIMKNAYKALTADPAFEGYVNYPKLENILVHDGQEEVWGAGQGPDCKGRTRFSEHYYNPVLADKGFKGGDGPDAASRWAEQAYMELMTAHSPVEKPLAWSAHFVADMWIPYHVTGCHVEDLNKLMGNGGRFPSEVYGHTDLCYKCVSPTAGNDVFIREHAAFMDVYNAYPKECDWFDPWYWNGGIMSGGSKTSSHTLYEGAIHPTLVEHEAKIHPFWANPKETRFDKPQVPFGQAVREFAIRCAKHTRLKLLPFYNKPQDGLNHAIDAVYTLWRGMITALRPNLSHTRNSSGELEISVRIKNKADEAARGVKARLCVMKADKWAEVGVVDFGTDIAPRTELPIKNAWTVRPDSASGQFKLKIEVTARYEKTPDAQYVSKIYTTASDNPRYYKGTFTEYKWLNSAFGRIECSDTGTATATVYFGEVVGYGEETAKARDLVIIKFPSTLIISGGDGRPLACGNRSQPAEFTSYGVHDGANFKPYHGAGARCWIAGKFDENTLTGAYEYKEHDPESGYGSINKVEVNLKRVGSLAESGREEQGGADPVRDLLDQLGGESREREGASPGMDGELDRIFKK